MSTGDSAADNASLYANRETIHPRHVTGLFATLRVSAVLLLLGIYYFLPWVTWDGRQAVLFDLPARKFYLFGLTLWPQDFVYLAALLIVAALSLFLFTAVAGRLWCGYACPQTVWTELFMWIERKVEGDRNQRIKLDRSESSTRKIRLKAVKHAIWLLLSLWTGYTFVGYFTPIIELGSKVLSFTLGPWETFWVLFYGFATYGNAGWMREQVCMYMCPYARFQSAMFDRNTLIISYDERRGEPRGHRKRSAIPDQLGLGDCVDCKLCVQVCPTGIDIREGLQYECIGCAACIDACDGVMEKLDYPKGLIRYTTENALDSGTTRIFRPRVILYGIVLVVLCGLITYSLATRDLVELDVIRDRNVLYRTTAEGNIENIYTLKILNKSDQAQELDLEVDDLVGATINGNRRFLVAAGEVREETVSVEITPASAPRGAVDIALVLRDQNEPVTQSTARFLVPVR